MAWGYFTRVVDYRRPLRNVAFTIFPAARPQQVPRDLLDYAVSRGEATEAKAPRKDVAPSTAGVNGRVKKARKPAVAARRKS